MPNKTGGMAAQRLGRLSWRGRPDRLQAGMSLSTAVGCAGFQLRNFAEDLFAKRWRAATKPSPSTRVGELLTKVGEGKQAGGSSKRDATGKKTR